MTKTIQNIIDFIRNFNKKQYPDNFQFKSYINIDEYNRIGNNYINILAYKFNSNDKDQNNITINYNELIFNVSFAMEDNNMLVYIVLY